MEDALPFHGEITEQKRRHNEQAMSDRCPNCFFYIISIIMEILVAHELMACS